MGAAMNTLHGLSFPLSMIVLFYIFRFLLSVMHYFGGFNPWTSKIRQTES